jgi:hypothetical protein
VNGEVKLWDFRGPERAVETWDLFPGGLAAFDVHSQSGVFAGCVTPLAWISVMFTNRPPGFPVYLPRTGGLSVLSYIQYRALQFFPPQL